ncbi:serine/threonine-protein kinase [Sorangium cellulosum]|uniref:serine/threonine-protein kinase n=1 Tax=Sorangium cellulosum TaxID=56 RepID=UPI0013316F59|nr:serine/threonine-protein kinase [Sorangium cellulosum]
MSGIAPGIVIAGRYRVERELARGAMGSVWVGRHLQLDVDIAIKFMAPEYAASTELRARFEREARAAAMLKSAHAVHIYDYGIEGGAPYIVMELLEGEDLSARLAREARLTLPATLNIVEQVGRALRRAHELGLVHRDLKPGNIFLALQDGEQTAKVVDFGIAKAVGPVMNVQATRPGALLGSPSYMSPEQVRSSSRVDHRSDLWSLGVIAYQCVTGQLPFPGGELGDVLVEICTAPIPLASQLLPGLGPEVDAFFQRALQRDPAQRFQSATELVEAFAALPGARAAGASGPPRHPSAHDAQDPPAAALASTADARAPSAVAQGMAPGAQGIAPAAQAPTPPVQAMAPAAQAPTPPAQAMAPAAQAPMPPVQAMAPAVQATVPAAQATVLAPGPLHPPGSGTLSPSSQTQPDLRPPRGRGRAGLVVGAALGAAALGLGGFLLWRSAPASAPDEPAAAAPAASVAGEAPGAASAGAVPAEPAADRNAAPPAPAEPAASGSADAAPASGSAAPAAPSASGGPAAPTRPRAPGKAGGRPPANNSDDLLNHM